MSYFLEMFKRYADFTGRSTRTEFWWAYGIQTVINMVLGFLITLVSGLAVTADGMYDFSGVSTIGWILMGLSVVYSLATFIPVLALAIRRLRDAGYKWWVYLLCITVGSCACGIGSIVLLVLWCMPTKEDANTYNY